MNYAAISADNGFAAELNNNPAWFGNVYHLLLGGRDCKGVLGGMAKVDNCGTCDADPTNDCKIAFVTSSVHDGNLGGLSGADSICQALADDKFSGTFKVWLSDSTLSPSTRFTRHSGPYTLTDGTVIASGWADLNDGMLLTPLNVDERKSKISPSQPLVWTNTEWNGTIVSSEAMHTCDDWRNSTTGYDARGGSSSRYDYDEWTWFDVTTCDHELHLYCFEQ